MDSDKNFKLPKCFESACGKDGSNLSVSLRLRVIIARALLYDPKILVIEDGADAVRLDQHGRNHVLKAAENAMEGRTVILMSNSMDSPLVRKCDRILLMMEDGKIVEQKCK